MICQTKKNFRRTLELASQRRSQINMKKTIKGQHPYIYIGKVLINVSD